MESLLHNSAPQAPENGAAECFISRFRTRTSRRIFMTYSESLLPKQFLGDVYRRNGDVKRLVAPFLGGEVGGWGWGAIVELIGTD
jgi:hypothetical protein